MKLFITFRGGGESIIFSKKKKKGILNADKSCCNKLITFYFDESATFGLLALYAQ